MRRVVLLEHISLDGFVAGPNGEMEWIRVDDEMWDYVNPITDRADTAIYGRVTYEMMAAYWPTAGDAADATPHDIHHSRWVNNAIKLVFSKTLQAAAWGKSAPATLVRDDVVDVLRQMKDQPGADMLILGSASLARSCIQHGLIDDYWLNVNPVILGGGTPLFPKAQSSLGLQLVSNRSLSSGVVGLHYVAAY